MAVRIGHASIDERGKAKGGALGDNNGKEVCIRKWYNHKWNCLLRCDDENKAELMARTCEKGCANNNVGYDQNNRNTLEKQAILVGYDLSKIGVRCATDCSAFMSTCARSAGIPILNHNGNAPTTSTMVKDFVNSGFFTAYRDSKYLTSDKYLKRGDILVKEGSHTVMVLDNGASIQIDKPQEKIEYEIVYSVGKTYTLNANMFVRKSPKGDKKKLSELSKDGQLHSYNDGSGNAIMKKGTKVTCKGSQTIGNQVWIQIPSGWICAFDNGQLYVS